MADDKRATGVEAAAAWMDSARREIGRTFDALGLGPQEATHCTVAEFRGAVLRAYSPAEARGPAVLIVPAPFKRPYIWDLMPQVSVIRRCLERDMRVYLLEWLIPTPNEDEFGLAEYADRLPLAALDFIKDATSVSAPLLAGHSLGGTFAAIVASLYPKRVGGLILADAPLAFGEHGGPIARAVRSMPHTNIIRERAGSPIAGTVINALSVGAVPEAFQLQRAADLVASVFDPNALAIHTRVERWTYDEFPLPGRLFVEIAEQLYREDRFMQGTLEVGERKVSILNLKAPVIAVTNPVGRVVPPRSVLDGLEAVRNLDYEALEYEADRGPMIQHVGPLVAPSAHARIWPRILDWASDVARRMQA